jgi:uncharacterized membrane protein YdjX (TVP38/TMEM64 family)/sterol desaturase/sphingolipid hydroxylase (fatty acid hydroxylase superfamily)
VTNLSLTTLNSILVWATVGSIAYATALFAAEQGMGLLHWIALPPWAAAVVTLLGLDFALYLHHVLFHAVPIFWRLHQVHHADIDIDATTGLRFHPFEIFLSFGLKMAVVILLGAVPWVVVAFEILLNAASIFNHSNVAIAERVEAWLRWVLVTPDMHRIHHSTRAVETNSNFGFSFSWWDRICGTYRAHPALGQRRMDIGLSDYRTPLTLGQLLLLPFRGNAGRYTFAGARSAQVERKNVSSLNPRLLRIGVSILLVGVIVLAWLARDRLTPEAITAWVEDSGSWGPAVFVGLYMVAPALFLPGSVLTLAGGALFGPFSGALLSLTGATIGATVAFLLARYLAADWVERRVSGKLQDIKAGVEREGWRFVAFARLVPLFPFNLLNYALGLTRVSVQTFAATSFLAMAPGAVAYAYLGHAGREAISGGPDLVQKGLFAFALLAAVTLLPSLIHRWRRPEKMSPQQLQTFISQGKAPLVLDVRNPDEFARGHISGAVLYPLPEFDTKLEELTAHRAHSIVTV